MSTESDSKSLLDKGRDFLFDLILSYLILSYLIWCHSILNLCFVQNLLEHEGEIFSRPARTWFQTEKQKKELAAAAAAAAEGRIVFEDATGSRTFWE